MNTAERTLIERYLQARAPREDQIFPEYGESRTTARMFPRPKMPNDSWDLQRFFYNSYDERRYKGRIYKSQTTWDQGAKELADWVLKGCRENGWQEPKSFRDGAKWYKNAYLTRAQINYDEDPFIEFEALYDKYEDWKEERSRKIRSNILIKVRSRHDPLRQQCSPEELQARYLLRDLLTEREWRRYVTNGFIMVRGTSGSFYQIFQNQKPINVYRNGKKTHTLCIHTVKDCPPTDHLINMKAMIELDEESVWLSANQKPVGRVDRYGAPILSGADWRNIEEAMRRHAAGASREVHIPNLWPPDLLQSLSESARYIREAQLQQGGLALGC